MPSKLKLLFDKGQEVGPYHFIFIDYAPTVYREYKSRKSLHATRYGYFLCPLCKENVVCVPLSKVYNGYIKSCGCIRHKNKGLRNGHAVDLTNKTFGHLTALFPTDKRVNGKIVWHCKCDCGKEVDVQSAHLVNGHTKSCGHIKSEGEQIISNCLTRLGISFLQEHTFIDCVNPKTNKKLKFDFYLPEYNILIEYDGSQHFITQERGWYTQEELKKIQERDRIKDNYCKTKHIRLVRIPYTDFLKINDTYILDILEEYGSYCTRGYA